MVRKGSPVRSRKEARIEPAPAVSAGRRETLVSPHVRTQDLGNHDLLALRLQGQADCEKVLDDGVVQVGGDALAVLDDGEPA